MKIRDIVLQVNQEYIYSAAQQEEYRTEPPFKLQGSYRNMNKIAEKVVSLMNEEELETVILSHYENESQTLTTGAEANFLKFKELMGKLTEEEQARWEEIKVSYVKIQRMKTLGTQAYIQDVLNSIGGISTGIKSLEETIQAFPKDSRTQELAQLGESINLTIEGQSKSQEEMLDSQAELIKKLSQVLKEHSKTITQKVDVDSNVLAQLESQQKEFQKVLQESLQEKLVEATKEQPKNMLEVRIVDKQLLDEQRIEFSLLVENFSSQSIRQLDGKLSLFNEAEQLIYSEEISCEQLFQEQMNWKVNFDFSEKETVYAQLKDIPFGKLKYSFEVKRLGF